MNRISACITAFTRIVCAILVTVLSVSVSLSQTCSGTPSPGTVTATSGGLSVTDMIQVCSAGQVVFTVSGQSDGDGITMQWQVSADNVSWSDINSATDNTYTLDVPDDFVAGYYRMKVSCTGSGAVAYTNAVLVTFLTIQGYNALPFEESFEGAWAHICRNGELPSPRGPFAWRNWPQSGNSSWRREDSYLEGEWSSDFGAYSPGGSEGDHSARFHSTYGTRGYLDLFLDMSVAPETKKLSFDYMNEDGDDKLIIWLSVDGGVTFTRLDSVATAAVWTSKNIYLNTLSPSAIIRFEAIADNGNTDIGLDNVRVAAVTPCSGTPVAGAAVADNSAVCAGHPFTLSLDALPGNTEAITWQWQSSPRGAGNWQDIAGAVKEVYTGTEESATDYRLQITCRFGGTAYSNIVPVDYINGVAGTGYTINNTLPSGGGNFTSFNEAYDFLKCGVSGPVVFTVAPNSGPYHEQLIIESIHGMSSVNTVTFKGNGNRIHFSSVDSEERAVIKLRGADYFIFDSLEIDATREDNLLTRYGYGVHLMNDADSNVFRHCRIIADTTFSSYGIMAVVINGSNTDLYNGDGNCDNNIFDEDTIIGGEFGVYISAAVSAPNSLNRITNCVIRDFDSRGISLFGTNNTWIEGNTFSVLYRKVMGSVATYIYGAGGSNGTRIFRNRFTHPFGPVSSLYNNFFGIIEGFSDSWPNSGTQISNNVFHEIGRCNGATAIMVSYSNAFIFHNTFDLSASAAADSVGFSGVRVTAQNNNSVILNNIFTGYNNLRGNVWALYSFGSSIISDNNVFSFTGTTNSYAGHLGDNDYATLNNWQLGTGADAGSVNTDPLYENLAQGNLRPQSRYMDNKGIPVGVGEDITGAARNMATPDPGAYEFTAAPCLPLHAGTYTIDKNKPAGAGNFISFNAAKDAMRCGIDGPVVFDVNGGVYNEQLILTSIEGTSDINTVTFKGNGNTIQYSSVSSAERAVIKLRGASHIILDSLVIDAAPKGDPAGRYGYGVQFIDNADSNIVRRCNILTDTLHHDVIRNFGAVVMTPVDEGTESVGDTRCNADTVTDCRLSGGNASVIVTGTASDLVFTNNQILNFELWGYYFYDNISNVLIEGNEISRPSFAGNTCLGISIAGGAQSHSFTVSRNVIHHLYNPDVQPLNCMAMVLNGMNRGMPDKALRVENNLIYDIHGSGGHLNGILVGDVENMMMAHNTISYDGISAGLPGASGSGVSISSGVSGVFANNIVSVTRTGPGTRSAMSMTGLAPEVTFERNDYSVADDPGNYIATIGSLGEYKTLAEWQAAISGDDHTTATDPLFRNPSAGDFMPTAEAIDNLGSPMGVFMDLNNQPRSVTTPDPGAYEFTVPVCTSPPDAGRAVVSPNAGVCMGTKVSLTVQQSSLGAGQRYIWQKAASGAGPWITISDTLMDGRVPFVTRVTAENYFRCLVTCSGHTDSSDVAVVTLNAGMPSGVYTINHAAATSYPAGKNFASFTEAVNAMACGIAGPVVFRAAAGTYSEQVRIPAIGNASLVNTVRFESDGGNNADVILAYTAADAADNYVLLLDSASYISFRNISVVPGGADFARAVVMSGEASWDTIAGCKMPLPVCAVTSADNASLQVAGVYAEGVTGVHNVIQENEIINGSRAVYISGASADQPAKYLEVVGNVMEKPFAAGVESANTVSATIADNKMHLSASFNTQAYGIIAANIDSAFTIQHNRIEIDHMPASAFVMGINLNRSAAASGIKSRIEGNIILAKEDNSAGLFGVGMSGIGHCLFVNNVIHLNTSGIPSFGLNHVSSRIDYYNNTIQNASVNPNGFAVSFNESEVHGSVVKNNIFSNTGGGIVMNMQQPEFITSDYNTLYTTGNILAGTSLPSAVYTNLADWRAASGNDLNSIVYRPVLSGDSLRPDVNDPEVWAIHGRGVQIADNNHDMFGAARPVTLQEGVPDMGAYEFLPVSVPVALKAVPAAPVAGQAQVFFLGTDTVARINWHAGSTVPAGIVLRRYSGVPPVNITPAEKYMYFYTSAEVTGSSSLSCDVAQYYIDPWQGFINNQEYIKLGKTNAAGVWSANVGSTTNALANIISERGLDKLFKFTGLLNATDATLPVVVSNDSSNAGTEFWAAYGHHQRFETDNAQEMQLMMSAGDRAAHVTVSVPGVGWVSEYTIPANTSVLSNKLPKTGSYDCRLEEEGVFNKGIHITSDFPVHVAVMSGRSADVSANDAVTESGATLLLPVGTYGYEYTTMATRQYANDHSWSWINIVAAYDNTEVEVTPSRSTRGGHKAGVPYTILLQKGEVYQIMGQQLNPSEGHDLTGTIVRSVKNTEGKCYPVAVFSGSSATAIGCATGTLTSSVPYDNLVQQNLPYHAWGRHYVTAPVMTHEDAAIAMTTLYRIMVSDPATVVRVNGAVLPAGSLVDNLYYRWQSNTADDISADKPVMVAQYMVSPQGCSAPGTDNNFIDAEMFYLTPVEHAVKKVVFFRHNIGFDGMGLDGSNSVSLVIPDAGLNTLLIDGGRDWLSYPCANAPGYSQVVKRWNLAGRDEADRNATFTIESNTPFTGITYGLGENESYGYNLGMRIDTGIVVRNALPAGDTALQVCAGIPVQLHTWLSIKPAAITWQSSVLFTGISPRTDVQEAPPVVKDSMVVNGIKEYKLVSGAYFTFTDTGMFTIPVIITDNAIENCDHTLFSYVTVHVAATPFASFAVPAQICVGEPALFAAQDTLAGGAIEHWEWDFGNGTTSALHQGTARFDRAGSYNVKFTVTSGAGCTADTIRTVAVTECRDKLFIPNSFSPNGNGLNETFKVYGLGVKAIHLMVFNQWGQKIFETSDKEQGWDGAYKGSRQPSGVYIYVCKILFTDGTEVTKKGSVNLIR